MRIIKTKVYTIDEHPNKEKCYKWIRDNWHDLNQHGVEEAIQSIKALHKKIGGSFNYSVSAVPDRGEYIKFRDYSSERLQELDANEYPLTGVCWDEPLIIGLKEGNPTLVLKILHAETDYIYSDEGLFDLCEANGYEFDEDGNYTIA